MREFLYGRQAVVEALRAGRRALFKLVVAENVQSKGAVAEAIALANRQSLAVERVPRSQLDRITPEHQGIVAQVSGYPYVDLEAILATGKKQADAEKTPLLVLALDCVQDPQNLGTLLRTAEAAGVHGAIFPRHRAASITPAVVNASSGATEYLRIAQVTNLTHALKTLKEADVWVAGLECVPEAQEYTLADLTGPLALVVGSEGQGISRLVREACDYIIKLPMLGHIGSLNVSIAGSIALYEILRQRRQSVSQKPPNGG
jgi:23S rRNA (guanosine2251-2'-O)-methyltransferase